MKKRFIEIAVKMLVAALTAFATAITTTSCMGRGPFRSLDCPGCPRLCRREPTHLPEYAGKEGISGVKPKGFFIELSDVSFSMDCTLSYLWHSYDAR